MTSYINLQLANANGEDQESLHYARIQNPLAPAIRNQVVANPLFMQDPHEYRTSWSVLKDNGYQQDGRMGYSVKFVTLGSLLSGIPSSNGTNSWSNYLAPDATMEIDAQSISH